MRGSRTEFVWLLRYREGHHFSSTRSKYLSPFRELYLADKRPIPNVSTRAKNREHVSLCNSQFFAKRSLRKSREKHRDTSWLENSGVERGFYPLVTRSDGGTIARSLFRGSRGAGGMSETESAEEN